MSFKTSIFSVSLNLPLLFWPFSPIHFLFSPLANLSSHVKDATSISVSKPVATISNSLYVILRSPLQRPLDLYLYTEQPDTKPLISGNIWVVSFAYLICIHWNSKLNASGQVESLSSWPCEAHKYIKFIDMCQLAGRGNLMKIQRLEHRSSHQV